TVQNGYTKPDLRNSFIVGAGLAYALGANGDISLSTSAVSAGTPTINSPTISVANLPAHAHTFNYTAGQALFTTPPSYSAYSVTGSSALTDQTCTTSSIGSGTALPITAAAMGTHLHTVQVGPFYALYFAVYVG